jgi:hypothetical protein
VEAYEAERVAVAATETYQQRDERDEASGNVVEALRAQLAGAEFFGRVPAATAPQMQADVV